MILITAATGQVAGRAVRDLLAAGRSVRVLVREASVATAFAGAEFAVGDFEGDDGIARALDGIDTIFLAGRDGPHAVEQHRRVLGHARRAGVRHVVKLSAIGAARDAPVALMRDHFEVDEEVREGPWGWALLQPHLYMQNLLRAAPAVLASGVLAAPLGHRRFPLVDTADVGAAAAIILADPQAHAGCTYAVTGPTALSYDDVAAALSRVAGRPVIYAALSPQHYEADLISSGVPDWRAFDLAHIAQAYAAADRHVTPALSQLLGRSPRSLIDFLTDHSNDFGCDGMADLARGSGH